MKQYWKTIGLDEPYWVLTTDGVFRNAEADSDLAAELSPKEFREIFPNAYQVDEDEIGHYLYKKWGGWRDRTTDHGLGR